MLTPLKWALLSKLVLAACLLGAAGYAAAQRTQQPGAPANIFQICQLTTKMSGLVQVQNASGIALQDAFLVSTYDNYNNGQPGTGNAILIYECPLLGTGGVWTALKLPPTSNCLQDGAAIGETMALNICGNVLVVGSMPIENAATGVASSGCLIALDLNGNYLADVKSSDINGPWGSTCTYNQASDEITLFVSSVLGGLSSGNATQTGRKMLQQVSGGFIARFTFKTPTPGVFNLGQGTVLVSGISTSPVTPVVANAPAPGGIGGNPGVSNAGSSYLSPGNPALTEQGTLYFPSYHDNAIGTIPNAVSTTVTNVNAKDVLKSYQGLNGPNSLSYRGGLMVGANGLDGNLFTFLVTPTVPIFLYWLDLVNPANTPGTLFNAVVGTDMRKYFINEASNSVDVIGPPPAPPPGDAANLCTANYNDVQCDTCVESFCFVEQYYGSTTWTNANCNTPAYTSCHLDQLTNSVQQLGSGFGDLLTNGTVCNCDYNFGNR